MCARLAAIGIPLPDKGQHRSSRSFGVSSLFLALLVLLINCTHLVQSLEEKEIKLCVVYERNNQPVVSAPIECFDDDILGTDSKLASGFSGVDGCIILDYEFQSSLNDRKPDIYCNIKEQEADDYTITKTDIKRNWDEFTADFGTIAIQGRTEQPTVGPSVAPSISLSPTLSPTLSPVPTVSYSPTLSTAPSATPSISVLPTQFPETSSPSLSPTTVEEKCSNIAQVQIIDIFSVKFSVFMILGVIIAAIMTIPAVSIYFHDTEEKPTASYMYSCVMRFIGSFFSATVLIGGIHQYIISKGCAEEYTTTIGPMPYTTAFLTQTFEFAIDVAMFPGLCCEPHFYSGKIDFYQNVRWNNKRRATTPCASIFGFFPSRPSHGNHAHPEFFACLMSVLWILILLSQIIGNGIVTNDFSSNNSLNDGNDVHILWVNIIALFVTLSCSFLGLYYLIGMIFGETKVGEDKIRPFFFRQFKLIAVDVPGLIITAIIKPSGLVIFWIAQFVDDIFPIVPGFIFEKCKEEYDNEDGGNLRNDVEQDADNNGSFDKSVVLPLKFSYFHNHFFFRIDRKLYTLLEDRVTETYWKDFCDHLDGALHQIPALKRSRSHVSCLKIPCFFVGIALSIVYWNAMYWQYFATDKDQLLVSQAIESTLYYGLLITFCTIGAFICFKICFVPNSVAERKAIDDIQDICDRFSDESNVQFNLKFTNDAFRREWWCRGGFFCAPKQNIDSICGIECILFNRSDDNEYGHLGQPPPPSAPAMLATEDIVKAHIVED